MNNLIKISNDVYFISQRLKDIDKDYFLCYNLLLKRYEVHCEGQYRNTYCFSVPFDELDERTLFYALKTRSQNTDKLIEEIDKNNQLLYEKSIKKQVELLREVVCL